MRASMLLLPAAFAAAIALSPPPAATAGEGHAAKLFQHSCASCHTVPDPAIRTDRAWLDQVRRTA